MCTETKIINVAVGVLVNTEGEVLFAQRPHDKTYTGWWELPGGKIEKNETVSQAIIRELHEELGIHVSAVTPWVTHTHHYPHATVVLNFCLIDAWKNEPQGMEGQTLSWIRFSPADQALIEQRINERLKRIADLPVDATESHTWQAQALSTEEAIHLSTSPSIHPLLPASLPVIRWLQLPRLYAITQINRSENLSRFLSTLEQQLQQGLRLVQFREPAWQTQEGELAVHQGYTQVLELCRRYQAYLLVNSVHPLSWSEEADGLHLRSTDIALASAFKKTPNKWLGASVHNDQELSQAKQMEVDFAVLSPIAKTSSHPDISEGMGWTCFEQLAQYAGLPIFALGGLARTDLKLAQTHRAHGIAGISMFWENK